MYALQAYNKQRIEKSTLFTEDMLVEVEHYFIELIRNRTISLADYADMRPPHHGWHVTIDKPRIVDGRHFESLEGIVTRVGKARTGKHSWLAEVAFGGETWVFPAYTLRQRTQEHAGSVV